MSQQVTITSVTGNTPVNIYYCDSFSANCVYVATVSTFPYVFDVPSPYDESNFVIKIIDTQGCIDGEIVYLTPTPTSSQTPTQTITPTQTSSQTPTMSQTPTQTPTFTPSQTATPTFTPTPTLTPAIATHPIGQNKFALSGDSCEDTITVNAYYTYISESNSTPVIGAKVYQTLVGVTLYNPLNGENKWIKMVFGGNFYAVQIDPQGNITNFAFCYSVIPVTPSQTPSQTPTQTQTPSSVIFQPCNVLINGSNSGIFEYDVTANTLSVLGNLITSPDVAMTDTKMWLYSSPYQMTEYDITLNPWSYSFNRQIVTQFYRSGTGLTAKSNTKLVVGGFLISEMDITNNTATYTTLFQLPNGGEVTGDIYYNPYTNRYIISYCKSTGGCWLGEFTSTGVLWNETQLPPSWGATVFAIFSSGGVLYICRTLPSGPGEIYSVNSTTMQLTFVQNIDLSNDNLVSGAAQQPICSDFGFTRTPQPTQTQTQTPTPSVTPPPCYPTLASNCPLFITNTNGNLYYYNLSANTSNILPPWPTLTSFPMTNIAITDTKMYALDIQGIVYDFNYTITPTTGCLSLSYVQSIDLFPYYISNAYCIAVKDNNTLFVGSNDTTGTTIYNFNLTTSAMTTYMEVGNNALVSGMIYNTGNTQMVLSYFQPLSGFTGQIQLYSGTTLLSSISTSELTTNASGLYWDGARVVGINRDNGRRWIYNFSATTSTELLPAVPTYGGNQIGGTGMKVSCQNFNVPY